MTIERDKYIKIPVWLVSVMLPLLVSATVAIVTSQVSQATTKKQVEINTKDIENKADKKDIEYIKTALEDIKSDIRNLKQ